MLPEKYQERQLVPRNCAKLLALESQAILDFFLYCATRPLLRHMKKGRGIVMVIPGFTAGDWATVLTRDFLTRLGYTVYGWELGVNLGYDEEVDELLSARVIQLYRRHGEKISLIGWSLGGVFARELARWSPEMIKSVITCGSPFQHMNDVAIAGLYEKIVGTKINDMNPAMLATIAKEPPVPTTAIIGAYDTIVPVHCSYQPELAHTETVMVPCCHTSIHFSIFSLAVMANRLAQGEFSWKPFKSKIFNAIKRLLPFIPQPENTPQLRALPALS